MLGQMHEFGRRGVVQNYAEAARWYHRAAEQGDAYAQSSLGFMYVQGIAVPYDPVQAYKWLNLAAARFEDPEKEAASLFSASQIVERAAFSRAAKELQQATTKARELVKRRMTAAQIIEAQKLASAWKPSSEVMKAIRPADLEEMAKIMGAAARKKCSEGDQAACAYLDQKH
jgi:hypothetical protein